MVERQEGAERSYRQKEQVVKGSDAERTDELWKTGRVGGRKINGGGTFFKFYCNI